VQAGDMMFLISLKYNVSFSALLAANPTVNPNLIYVGQTIVIP
jgi:LysM repeat protein